MSISRFVIVGGNACMIWANTDGSVCNPLIVDTPDSMGLKEKVSNLFGDESVRSRILSWSSAQMALETFVKVSERT